MIAGVGIDMIEVERVMEKIDRNEAFRDKIFSPEEISWCESKGKNKGQHYAARFAAKEAFLKATGRGLLLGYDLSNVEIVSDEAGKPGLLLKGSFKIYAQNNKWSTFHLSLSHLGTIACAVVIIEF